MVRITAWKCNGSGTLFETKKSFLVHKSRRAYERSLTIRRDDRLAILKSRVDVVRSMTSFAEIEDWLNSNADALYALVEFKHRDRLWRKVSKTEKYSLSNVKLKKMVWTAIPTTHNAPIGRRTTGWKQGEKAERHYGWRGEMSFTQKNSAGFGSDVFKGIGINTESGGGGEHQSYGVVLFAEDFPLMVQMMKAEGRLDPAIPFPQPLLSPVLEGA